MAPLGILAGLILLILGRQLFWVFVGILGFVLGMDVAAQLIPDGGPMVLLVAVVVGILGALIAYLFYQVAIAVAGFLAGGRIGVELVTALTPLTPQVMWLTFIVAGVIGAILLLLIFDWALIVLSSLPGASVVVQHIAIQPNMRAILFITLVIAGVAIQAGMLRRRSPAR